MAPIVRGQKTAITKQNPALRQIQVGLNWNAPNSMEVDASAFLVGTDGNITKEADFVFYGQPSSSCQSVKLNQMASVLEKQSFFIDLTRIPQSVQKVVFSVTIHNGEQKKQSFKDVSQIELIMTDEKTRTEIVHFPITHGFSNETAIIVGDIYRHAGQWKFNPVGAGYFGGLAALCKDFGIEVATEAKPVQQKQAVPPTPKTTQAAPPPVTQQSKPKKIELKKKQSVNIQKSKMVTATLEWSSSKDLDLYCFYVTKDNEFGKIYYRNLGSATLAPYIVLDGDSLEAGKETIRIYRPEALKYVLFAAYSALSNGTGSFYRMRAKAVVDNHMGSVVTAPLLERNDYAYWVCIAQIDFTNPTDMKISHVETYSADHSENSPLLYADGSFQMDVGPIEFKDEEDYIDYFGE
ncbi:TerD family protein [Neobacillus cucumis]|uniref:TerD family protein n=1 Tax=Neobacillus cucumis TaxID=1740721 RepID=UPI001962D440|nr:TerD family protein [Neobacillus cucumis]MBM7656431.1 stress response protein SCP2 [Neobacillus cucumis]